MIKEDFTLGKFQDTLDASFAADAAHFVTAERRGYIARAVVDIHIARFNAARERDGLIKRSVHRGIQTVNRIVGDVQRIRQVLVRNDAHHGICISLVTSVKITGWT